MECRFNDDSKLDDSHLTSQMFNLNSKIDSEISYFTRSEKFKIQLFVKKASKEFRDIGFS